MFAMLFTQQPRPHTLSLTINLYQLFYNWSKHANMSRNKAGIYKNYQNLEIFES